MPLPTLPCVDDYFMAPATQVLQNYTRHGRAQSEGLTDERFLALGIVRTLEGDESGRAFLQALADQPGVRAVARSTWFDALHSSRRRDVLAEVATRSYRHFEAELKGRDWLAGFPELADCPVWAVDGHQIEHACHAPRDAKDRQVPSGMTYGLCLHTGLMRPLARFQGDGQRQHEWPVFKKHWRRWCEGEPRPGMPIVVADPAYIDCQYWIMEKIRRQAMVITREKENMQPTIYGPNGFDPDDPVNRGVLADDTAGYSNAVLRRIHYRDPATGRELVFVTTCPAQIRPGLVAALYFMRWQIEKVYDVWKNKLKVTKAWAVGANAAITQAHFVALLHNLLTVFLARLEHTGLTENKVARRQADRLARLPPARRVPALEMIRALKILTAQFIRLVRHCLRFRIPWEQALTLFKQRLESYL